MYSKSQCRFGVYLKAELRAELRAELENYGQTSVLLSEQLYARMILFLISIPKGGEALLGHPS